MTKLTKLSKLAKMTKNGAKNLVFGSKTGVSKYSENTEYSELVFSVFCIFHIGSKSNLFFTSDSNFNRKFDYEFGTQGLTSHPWVDFTNMFMSTQIPKEQKQ
jgi:hypothetical protein